jgi:hypothetical protein
MERHVAPQMGQDEWHVTDVYLLTGSADGPVAVPKLALTFSVGGIELDKADGSVVWVCRWDELEEMSPVERSVLPDGRAGVAIVIVERAGRRGHRFVLAADDPESTEGWIRERAEAHGLRSAAHQAPVSRLLLVTIGLALGAALTLLLLSAAHVIHF